MRSRPDRPAITAERWRTLEPLLDAALAVPHAERAVFVATACGADDVLRDELAVLLRECDAQGKVSSPVDRPAVSYVPGAPDDAAEIAALRSALPGRYVIERLIGRGGTGVVYAARDIRHERTVAIKVLSADYPSPQFTERFLREIHVTAGLRHPRLLPLYDSGDAAGRPYYVMPFVAGGTLRDRLVNGPLLSTDEALDIMHDVAEALDYAHRNGVIHWDVKPENILLDESGAVLGDFGVAQASRALGTPAYMAPERSTSQKADRRADLYALGVVAYEMLAGVHPFAGTHADMPDALATRCPHVSPALDALVQCLLERAPDRRPPDARHVVRAIENIGAARVNGARREATRAGWFPPAWARARSTLVSVAVAAVTLIAAAALRMRDVNSPVFTSADSRVLVVPMENGTGDSSLAALGGIAGYYISDGLAEVKGIDVLSDDALAPGSDDITLRAAARRQGAAFVVTGNYRLIGDSIRMQPRVIAVNKWKVMASAAPVSASRSTPTALLDSLRQRVLGVVANAHDRQIPFASTSRPPASYAVFQQYMTALDVFSQGKHTASLRYLRRATELDSTYVPAYLTTISALENVHRYAEADSVIRFLEARRASLTPAEQASLDRERAATSGNARGALAASRRLSALAPGIQLNHYLHALWARRAGFLHECLTVAAPIADTFGRDPHDWMGKIYWGLVTTCRHQLGDYAAELASARAGLASHPDNPEIRADELRALAALGQIDSLSTRVDEMARLPKADGVVAPSTALEMVGLELLAHGHATEGRAALERAVSAYAALPAAEQLRDRSRLPQVRVLYALQRYDAASRLLHAAAAPDDSNPDTEAQRALIALRTGRGDEARRIDARMAAYHRQYDFGETQFQRARIASALKDMPRAMQLLRQAVAEGFQPAIEIHRAIEFAPLRRDPVFQALIGSKD